MTVRWYTVILLGAFLGFGSAMGTLAFLMVSDNGMVMYRWVRNRIYRLNKWRNESGNQPGINQ